jgi:D-alanyl-D-alanine carboxypeptidase
MHANRLFDELGIPADYGRNPYLPRYAEAQDLEEVELNIVGRMQKLTPDTARDWRAMKLAARGERVELLMVSGFRGIADQTALIRRKLAAGIAIDKILSVNVAPGFSQHHTGRAIDVASPGSRPLTEAFEESAAFAWLREHAQTFGFRMPYVRNNVFGLAYEPWHWSQLG